MRTLLTRIRDVPLAPRFHQDTHLKNKRTPTHTHTHPAEGLLRLSTSSLPVYDLYPIKPVYD